MHGPPFSVASVLSLLKEVLTAMVVCMLEEHTGTFMDLARMDLFAEKTFLSGRGAVCNFPCLAIKIGPLKEFQLEMSRYLQEIQIMYAPNYTVNLVIQSDHLWCHWTYMPD